jgi:hypothetical protein
MCQQRYGISKRRACSALGVCCSVRHYKKRRPEDEEALREDITEVVQFDTIAWGKRIKDHLIY